MGIIPSKDTRRISFDNTITFSAALGGIGITKSLQDENSMDLEKIEAETTELNFTDNNKILDPQEEFEGDYWSHRIETLKKEHQAINQIVETEFEKKIESTNAIHQPVQVTPERIQKIKPCFDWRAKIVKCYEENPHQPLVCSGVVQAFTECVASCRMEK